MKEAAAGVSASESSLARLARVVPCGGPLWLQHLRRRGLERFGALGFPGSRDEEWKHTPVEPIVSPAYEEPPTGPLSAELPRWAPLTELGCSRVVLLNGRLVPELSELDELEDGVRVESLAAALKARPQTLETFLGQIAPWSDRTFAALNTALIRDGVVITVPDGAHLRQPVHLLHLSEVERDPIAIQARTLVVLGESSQASVLETYAGPEDRVYLTNAVTEIALGDDAILDHCRVQWEGRSAFHVGLLHARLARNARYANRSVSLGAALARHDVGAAMEGEGSEATVDGLYIAGDSQHVDNHTLLDHAKPHCPSHELYKGILAGRSRAVFNGRILVRPGAQRTDAKQSNRNLLLSDDAVVHTRPQLEIYADDVKCTHGATIGHLEEDALFYLRARGVPLPEARSLLIHGFARDILGRIAHSPLRDRLERAAVAMTSGETAASMEG